jgi:hypothetical protein
MATAFVERTEIGARFDPPIATPTSARLATLFWAVRPVLETSPDVAAVWLLNRDGVSPLPAGFATGASRALLGPVRLTASPRSSIVFRFELIEAAGPSPPPVTMSDAWVFARFV